MKKKTNGKLILKTLPEGKRRGAVIHYLGRIFKNTPRQKLNALLSKTPTILHKNVPAPLAQKIIAELEQRGAGAVFMPHAPRSTGQPQVASKQKTTDSPVKHASPSRQAARRRLPPSKKGENTPKQILRWRMLHLLRKLPDGSVLTCKIGGNPTRIKNSERQYQAHFMESCHVYGFHSSTESAYSS